MDHTVEKLNQKVAELRACVSNLPSPENPEQQAAVDGLNELVRIFEHMRASTEAFMERCPSEHTSDKE